MFFLLCEAPSNSCAHIDIYKATTVSTVVLKLAMGLDWPAQFSSETQRISHPNQIQTE